MEWGYDAVLLNTAVALSEDPVAMAGAFADAVQCRPRRLPAGAMAEQRRPAQHARAGHPFWHQE
jgi:thiazole synthase